MRAIDNVLIDQDQRDEELHRRQLAMLERNLGIDILEELDDPLVENIVLNPDGVVRVDRRGSGWSELRKMTAGQALRLIAAVAGCVDKVVDERSPSLEATLPTSGARFTAFIPPIVSSPGFALRRRASVIFSLEEYVSSGTLSEEHYAQLCIAVRTRLNIIVAGDTGTGKTTFTNALLQKIGEICPAHRLLIMEDTPELQCASANHVMFLSTIHFKLNDIIALSLRSQADRLIVGEIRHGHAADSLLTAWYTGHAGGVCTLHAPSAEATLGRLETMLDMSGITRSREAMRGLISAVVNLIVYITKDSDCKSGRRIKELLWIRGFDKQSQKYIFGAV